MKRKTTYWYLHNIKTNVDVAGSESKQEILKIKNEKYSRDASIVLVKEIMKYYV